MNARSDEKLFKPEGPQPLIPAMPKSAAYPVAALGPLREAVETVQKITQAPVAIAAQSALSVASLAVQGHVDVATLGGNRPTSVFMLTIAQSGERKSSCDDLLMEALYAFERRLMGGIQEALNAWQFKKDAWEEDRKAIFAKRKSGSLSETDAENAIAKLGACPAEPRSPDRLVTEPTFEGLTKLLATAQPSVGVFSDEGGQFLGGHAMNKEQRTKTVTAFNGLWNGKPIRRTRAGDGQMTLLGRRVALHLMVQPMLAEEFLRNEVANDSGFLARVLISHPETTIGTRVHSDEKVPSGPLDRFHRRIEELLSLDLPIDGDTGGLSTRVLPLSLEAKAALVSYSDRIEKAQKKGNALERLTATASKSAEQAARLAGVLAAFDDIECEEVSLAHMEMGIKLATYYLAEALRMSEAVIIERHIQDAEDIRTWLFEKSGKDIFTLRDVQQSGPSKLRGQRSKIERSLLLLEEHGWIVRLHPGTTVDGKTPKAAYKRVEVIGVS